LNAVNKLIRAASQRHVTLSADKDLLLLLLCK